MNRLMPISISVLLFTVVALAAAFLSSPAAGATVACLKLLDFSGSVTDQPRARDWMLATLSAVAETEQDAGEHTIGGYLVYGDTVRVLELAAGAPPDKVAGAAAAAMGGREWGDPLAAFDSALGRSGVPCVIHITDGSLDPPPQAGDEQSYAQRLLAVAAELRAAGIRVLTIVGAGTTEQTWRDFTSENGGIYLVNPDSVAVIAAIRELVPRNAQTPAPPPPMLPSTVPAPIAGPSGGFDYTFAAAVAVPCLMALASAVLAVAARRRPRRLAGWLEIEEKLDG